MTKFMEGEEVCIVNPSTNHDFMVGKIGIIQAITKSGIEVEFFYDTSWADFTWIFQPEEIESTGFYIDSNGFPQSIPAEQL